MQHHELEQQIETTGGYGPSGDNSDSSMDESDDEFYDCDFTDSAGERSVLLPCLASRSLLLLASI